MNKILISILVTAFFLVSNLATSTTVLAGADPGPPKEKEWKGEGEKIEFESMPILTIKDFLNGVVPEKRNKRIIFRFVQGAVVGSIVTIIIFYSLTHKEHEKMHQLLKQHGIEEHSH